MTHNGHWWDRSQPPPSFDYVVSTGD